MNRDLKEKIGRYIEGELSPLESSALEEQLISSGNEETLSLMKRLSSSELSDIPEPSPFMETRLMTRIRRAKKKKSVFSFLTAPLKVPSFAVIAVIILIIFLSVTVFKSASVEEPVETPQYYLSEENTGTDSDYYYTDDFFAAAYFDTLTQK
ncbi:MAG: hypothetical protein PHV06_00145 [bacterium]|nr:hypothetical protein [bacterium]